MTQPKRQKRDLARAISEAIQLGEFRAGERLRQIDLEQKFGATRFDVRAALDELVVRKAIEHIPNRGYRVAQVNREMLEHVKAVRIVLESAATPAVVAAIDAPALARLRALADNFSRMVRTGTRLEQSLVNRDFHRLVYKLSGNPVLEELIWSLRDRSRGSDVTIWNSHEALLRSDRDHHAMLEALENRDAGRLAALIASHILKDGV